MIRGSLHKLGASHTQSEKGHAHLGDFSTSGNFLNYLLPGFALCRVNIAKPMVATNERGEV